MAQTPIFVADAAGIAALTAQDALAAVRTTDGRLMAGGDSKFSTGVFDPGNLVAGQT